MAYVRGRGEGGAALRRRAARARLPAAPEHRHVRRDPRRVDARRARLLQAEHSWLVTY